MKSKILIFLIFLCIPFTVLANSKKEVNFSKCIDGDTAEFVMDKNIVKVRFLAIDTPESTKKIEPYGKEASIYTCKRLKEAKSIVLEFDDKSDKKDKYDRYLAWVFVDNSLLEKELVKKGYADVKYLYGNYKYNDELKELLKEAKKNKVGMWNDNKSFNLEYYIIHLNVWYKIFITFIILLIIFLYLKHDKKARKRILKKTETEFNKELRKYVNKKLK